MNFTILPCRCKEMVFLWCTFWQGETRGMLHDLLWIRLRIWQKNIRVRSMRLIVLHVASSIVVFLRVWQGNRRIQKVTDKSRGEGRLGIGMLHDASCIMVWMQCR